MNNMLICYGISYVSLNAIKYIINHNYLISTVYGIYSVHCFAKKIKKIDRLPIQKTLMKRIRNYFQY